MAHSTEISKKEEGGDVAVISDEFRARFPALAPSARTAAIMAEVFDEGDGPQITDLVRVKFPSGGSTSWIIEQGGEEKVFKELTGVLVLQSPQRVFWTDPDPKGVPPECMSIEAGKNAKPLPGGLYSPTGLRAAKNPSGLCANCPMSQWGSDLKGRAGQGCKERKLLFLMTEGSALPTLVTVPPASLKIIRQFIIGLAAQDTGYWAVEISLGLKAAQSKDGQKYAELVPKVVRHLDEGDVAATELYKEMVKQWVADSPPTLFVETDDDALDGEGVNLEDYAK